MKNKLTLGFLVGVATIAVIFFGITSKVYPVATVNDSFVEARQFQLASTAAQTYYQQIGSLYGAFASTTQAEFESQMRQVALQVLIEDRLVIDELTTIYETQPLKAAVAKRVSEAFSSSTPKTVEAISAMFGLTIEEFGEVVLAPRARIELLSAELEKSGVDFETWLDAALAKARVSITMKDLAWGVGRVELTGVPSYTAGVKELLAGFASTTEFLKESMASSTDEDGGQ